MTVYLVCGCARTGTSMMMKALEAGGMNAYYEPHRDEDMSGLHGDSNYQPNPGGFYEIEPAWTYRPDYPMIFSGRLIKCVYPECFRVRGNGHKVVFIRRDDEEMRQSWAAAFRGWHPFGDNYDARMNEAIAFLNGRATVTVVEYRDVIEAPMEQFERIEADGWPIDPVKAASVIDPSQYRFRRENLTVGVA